MSAGIGRAYIDVAAIGGRDEEIASAPEQAVAASWTEAVRGTAAAYAGVQDAQRAFAEADKLLAALGLPRSRPSSLAAGHSGLAVLLGAMERAFPGEGWARKAHDHISVAARHAARTGLTATGAWSGLAGLSFAAWLSHREGAAYGRLRRNIDAVLLPAVTATAGRVHDSRIVLGSDHDTISGISGVGGVLLARNHTDPWVQPVLDSVLDALISLAQPAADGPRWRTPPEIGDPESLARYPDGTCNLGLSHGIPGPLALLALATLAGVERPGQREAIDNLADWVAGCAQSSSTGRQWPSVVPWSRRAGAADADERRPATLRTRRVPVRLWRDAWCYGTPGVVRSLWLAGRARGRDDLQALALETMRDVRRRSPDQRGLTSPTMCHGKAGLLAIADLFATESGDVDIRALAEELEHDLIERYSDPETGWRRVHIDGTLIDSPGMLDGASGVALTLLAHHVPETPWQRALLIA